MGSKTSALVRESQLVDSRGETDTIRLWENYREQALLWRALAIFQIPTTLIALVFSLMLWATRSVVLNVPAKPLPGHYHAEEIPNEEFIEEATEFINLIATYQPANVRRQFEAAREMLKDTMLDRFDKDMMEEELKAIEKTYRTQIYFIDPTLTAVERNYDEVTVTLVGDRYKVVAGKELPTVKTKFTISLTTIPRNKINPYGIVVTNITHENIDRVDERRTG